MARKATRKPTKKAPAQAPRQSKKETVLALLRWKSGASIDDLMDATGWRAHSGRGFLSGTVKKKLALNLIAETKSNGARHYAVRGRS